FSSHARFPCSSPSSIQPSQWRIVERAFKMSLGWLVKPHGQIESLARRRGKPVLARTRILRLDGNTQAAIRIAPKASRPVADRMPSDGIGNKQAIAAAVKCDGPECPNLRPGIRREAQDIAPRAAKRLAFGIYFSHDVHRFVD